MALLSDQHYRPELPNGYPVGGTDFYFRAQCKNIVRLLIYTEDGAAEFPGATIATETVVDHSDLAL
jgi:hypothetical protein